MQKAGLPVPSLMAGQFRFSGLGRKGLMKELEEKTGWVYDPYHRSLEHRQKISIAHKGKKLVKNN